MPTLPEGVTRALKLSLAAALFVTVRVIAIPVGWAVVLAMLAAWSILKNTGFASVRMVQVEKEVIEL